MAHARLIDDPRNGHGQSYVGTMCKSLRFAQAVILCAALSAGCAEQHEPNAGQPTLDASTPDAGPSELVESKSAWSALVAANGNTYWYRATECSWSDRVSTWVQIRDGAVAHVDSVLEEGVPCGPYDPFAIDSPVGETLDVLYEECAQHIESTGFDNLVFAIDDEGVVRWCQYRLERCFDACDVGFHIAERGFGEGGFGDAGID
jgi:hypothetical protein